MAARDLVDETTRCIYTWVAAYGTNLFYLLDKASAKVWQDAVYGSKKDASNLLTSFTSWTECSDASRYREQLY